MCFDERMVAIQVLSESTRIALVIVLCSVVGAGCSSGGGSVSNHSVNQLRTGEFLREDYIKALCETLSPIRATREDGDPQMIIVGRDRDGFSFMPTHNFHEGDDLYRPTNGGRLRLGDAASAVFALVVHNSEAFSLVRGNFCLRFRFVGQSERWVTNAVIAGTYRDASGDEYVFSRDGQARFPRRKPFDYTLGMDHVLTPYDYIYSRGPEKSWAATITPQGISMHDVSGDNDEVVSPTARWMLTRIATPACK